MEVKTILLIVSIIVLLIVLYNYAFKNKNTLTGNVSGKTSQQVDPGSLASSLTGTGSSSNFSYSIWMFIDDWNYRYGESKIVFARMSSGNGTKEPCPSVTLGATENNIIINMAVYPGLDETPKSGTNYSIFNCGIANVPIQKWCNLLISVYGRTLDIYLDGKLVRTCILPGVPKIDSSAPIYVTPKGGFSGWTSTFQYWPESCNPQKAWNIYKDGYGSSWLSSIFGKYSVKVSIMENNVENSSIKF
jgi:hypothetical protein